MNIVSDETYHIYNQGNNRETLFIKQVDYIKFLQIFRRFVSPYCKVLAYCLMPNHFHFLIHTTKDSEEMKRVGNIDVCQLSNGFRLLQSNYAASFNKENKRTGSLFRQKTKAKAMIEGDKNYSFFAFQYIHQNPLRAGLVDKMEDWLYSSFADYMQLRKGTLCDQKLAFDLIGFDMKNFAEESNREIRNELVSKIFA